MTDTSTEFILIGAEGLIVTVLSLNTELLNTEHFGCGQQAAPGPRWYAFYIRPSISSNLNRTLTTEFFSGPGS